MNISPPERFLWKTINLVSHSYQPYKNSIWNLPRWVGRSCHRHRRLQSPACVWSQPSVLSYGSALLYCSGLVDGSMRFQSLVLLWWREEEETWMFVEEDWGFLLIRWWSYSWPYTDDQPHTWYVVRWSPKQSSFMKLFRQFELTATGFYFAVKMGYSGSCQWGKPGVLLIQIVKGISPCISPGIFL